jgi:hypothetical protein
MDGWFGMTGWMEGWLADWLAGWMDRQTLEWIDG